MCLRETMCKECDNYQTVKSKIEELNPHSQQILQDVTGNITAVISMKKELWDNYLTYKKNTCCKNTKFILKNSHDTINSSLELHSWKSTQENMTFLNTINN